MVYGNKSAPVILLFCAGFPDSVHAFLPLASKLAEENDCLCGVVCMPGYDVHHEDWKPEGYTFDEIVVSLREATKVLTGLSTNGTAKLIGVFHDWGCIVGSMLANRLYDETKDHGKVTFSKLIYFDVLPETHKSCGIQNERFCKRSIVVVAYTSAFTISFAIQRYISSYLAAPAFIFGNACLKLFGLLPTRKIDADSFKSHTPKYSLRKLIYMAYPYFYMYKSKLSGKETLESDFHLPVSLEKTPVLVS